MLLETTKYCQQNVQKILEPNQSVLVDFRIKDWPFVIFVDDNIFEVALNRGIFKKELMPLEFLKF